MKKKGHITVNGKLKRLPQHLLNKKKQFQKKKKKKRNKGHVKSQTMMQEFDPQSIAKQNISSYHGDQQTHADDYISSDTSAEWFDGDEDSDSKAYGPGGYLRVRIGDKLHNRYIIESKLGWGHFSTVWLATDLLAPDKSPRRFVALKIQKSAPHYLDAAKDEVQLLSAAKLKSREQPENYVVQMLDSFIVTASNGKHVVFVFEVLGQNLLDLIKSYNYRGLPIAMVKKIAREVLLGLDYLHSECSIIHTDLKPENVLISRTTSIDLAQLSRDKNRQLRTQYQRQLDRFLATLDQNQSNSSHGHHINSKTNQKHHPNHKSSPKSKTLSKSQRKKLTQKVVELKRNIEELEREWAVMVKGLREQKENDKVSVNKMRNGKNEVNGQNGKSETNGVHKEPETNRDLPLQAQFSWLHGRSLLDNSALPKDDPQLIEPVVKLCDLGNACWIDKHFTDDITTRQYRAPESMVGVGYGPAVDIWSLAAMLFELITGDYLFDPREKASTAEDEGYCRDEDHLALIGELCGHLDADGVTDHTPWPTEWTRKEDARWRLPGHSGSDDVIKQQRAGIQRPGNVDKYFGGHRVLRRDDGQEVWEWTERGDQLTRIQKLDYWSLAAVLEEKYKIPGQRRSERECRHVTRGHDEAREHSLASFLGQMLAVDPLQRATAREMLDHRWLVITPEDVAECLKAELRWFESGGKPVRDTNARYGLGSDSEAEGKEDDDSERAPDSNDSMSSETESSPEPGTKRKRPLLADRDRDSSVMARDEFANRRAESEPPPTWHRYLGIPWYSQFDDVLQFQQLPRRELEDDDEEFSDSMSESDDGGDGDVEDEEDLGDLDQQFEAMRINSINGNGYGGDDDESDSDSVMDQIHQNEKQSQHVQQSSMIFHGDSMSALRDGAEDKDEEDYPVEIVDDGQEEKEVNETNKMEQSEDDEDEIASLPIFDIAKRFPGPGASQCSVGSQSHSRQSSSSTFDID